MDYLIKEASLSRLFHHFNENGFAVISPYRPDTKQCPEDGEVSPEENLRRFAELRTKIRAFGFGFVPMMGYWKGKVGDCDYEGKELTFLIPNQEKNDRLRGLLLQWAKEYNQDAVLWSPGYGSVEVLDQEGNILDSYQNFRIDEPTDLFSILKGSNRKVSFSKAPANFKEWKQISGPRSWGEALKRKALGEILYPFTEEK